MFWDNQDPPSHNIEVLLESPDTKVEVFLEEDNIVQECKTLKKNIVNYFTRPDVIRRLIELITTEPPEDLPLSERFRHANVACEILTMGLPSLDEKLLADTVTLNLLYSYLENEPPLNPLLASFFSKTFGMLFTKKSDQDWFLYQQMCLKLLEYLKTQKNFLDLICKHFTTPIVPDLIMEMMGNVEGNQLKRSLYEWLNEERLVEKLIEIIGDPEQSEKHANVANFLCDLIHQGRTMRQTDLDTDSFEPAFEGSNPILKNIESATTLFALFNVILQPNAIESAIVSGITVVLKIIKPVKVTDERMERWILLQEREEEIHKELLSTVIRVIEPQLKYFNELLRNPPKRPDIITSAAKLSPPFGMTRLQICRLFTVLLQTNNEEIAKAICETDFIDTLLSLFKEYCWNNFLHSEVEKCFETIFSNGLSNNGNTNNNTTHASSEGKQNDTNNDYFYDDIKTDLMKIINDCVPKSEDNKDTSEQVKDETEKTQPETSANVDEKLNSSKETDEADVTKVPDNNPSVIQTHVIVSCQVVSKLIECWKANREVESGEKGRRLGYMGHLINIFKHITNCISESEHIGALIERNLRDDEERQLWQSIINPEDGDLTKALNTQSKLLANFKPSNYNASLEFFTDNNMSDAFNGLCNLMDSSDADVIFKLDYNTQLDEHDYDDDDGDDEYNNFYNENNEGKEKDLSNDDVKNALNLFQFGRSNEDDEGDDEENAAAGEGGDGGLTFYVLPHVNPFIDNSDPWQNTNMDSDIFNTNQSGFAEFPSIFGSSQPSTTTGNENVGDSCFSSKPDESTTASSAVTKPVPASTSSEEYDNNANVEIVSWSGDFTSFQIPKKPTHHTCTFIDDYEDDEGMWTKPLGGSASTTLTAVEQSQSVETTNQTDESKSAVTNGPVKAEASEHLQEDTPMNQLNNSIEDNSLVTETETAEDIILNENKTEEIKEINNDKNQKEDDDTTLKHKQNLLETGKQQLTDTPPPVTEVLDGSSTTEQTTT